ncbi:unnamed protein product, partial [marine sediment metagenome]
FAGLQPPYSELRSAKVVILPVPYDSTTEWRSGTRYGPQSIIDASRYLELYDLELEREICKVGIHTLPEVEPMMNSPEEMVNRVYQTTKKLIKQGKFVVMFGGEHSPTLGTVRAFKEAFPRLSVLHYAIKVSLFPIVIASKAKQPIRDSSLYSQFLSVKYLGSHL